MRFLTVAAAVLLYGISEAKKFSSPQDPARFHFYKTLSPGVICDGDTGPDGDTLWYQDLVGPTMGYLNLTTGKVREYTIPYSKGSHSTAPFIGNVSALQCVVRTGKDGMVYGGAGTRNEIVQVNPRSTPPGFKIFSPKNQNPAGNLQNFNDAWAADQGLFFSQTTGDVVTLFDYKTHKFTNYPCPTLGSGPLGMRTDKHNNLWFTNFQLQFISMLKNGTSHITEYHGCCAVGSFPEVLRSSTEDQKYLWANAFGQGGYIRIEPAEPDPAKKFKTFLNPRGTGTFPFENCNDYCGRIWYTSPTFDILTYYTPKTNHWTTIPVPAVPAKKKGGVPVAGNFEVIMHRGPGHYMWFSIGTLGRIGRYELDADCVGEPQ